MISTPTMSIEQASRFALMALNGTGREYPNSIIYVLNGLEDLQLQGPKALHPAFYGCFDWHSSVHSHWMLVHLLRTRSELPNAEQIRTQLAANLTAENLLAEKAYIDQPNRASFERTYGWAWLLKLAEELLIWDDAAGREWSRNLQPLADAFVQLYLDFLPRQTYPIRAGTHPNTAFGLTLALDYARHTGHKEFEKLLIERSLAYFASDKDYPAAWEPGGSDFLSPCLVEADLMRRVLPPSQFQDWLAHFLPGLSREEPANLFRPATVSDNTDPQIVHLDGLNLSRAWCMYGIASALPENDPAGRVLREAGHRHGQYALPM